MRLLRVATTTAILIVPLIAVHAAAQTASRTEKVDGYAEYYRGEWLVVDGQRLVLPPSVPIRARGGPLRRCATCRSATRSRRRAGATQPGPSS
jgi:hypothetical protein